jgi:hypothetical protein
MFKESNMMNLGEKHPKTVEELKDNFSRPELPKIAIELSELEKLCEGDMDLGGLLNEMTDYCERYTEIIARYQEANSKEETREVKEELAALDEERKITHDATMDSINILARALNGAGKNGRWVESLHGSRAAFGNFALRITYQRLMEMEVENGKEDHG